MHVSSSSSSKKINVLKFEITNEVKNNHSNVLSDKPSLLEPVLQRSYEYLGVPLGFQKPVIFLISLLSHLLNLLRAYDKISENH